jgi:hypothetical protein
LWGIIESETGQELELLQTQPSKTARNKGLPGVGPRVPRLGNGVPHALCPSLPVSVRHASIPIAVEDHHVDIRHQERIRVRGQVGAGGIVRPAGGGAAHRPAVAGVSASRRSRGGVDMCKSVELVCAG